MVFRRWCLQIVPVCTRCQRGHCLADTEFSRSLIMLLALVGVVVAPKYPRAQQQIKRYHEAMRVGILALVLSQRPKLLKVLRSEAGVLAPHSPICTTSRRPWHAVSGSCTPKQGLFVTFDAKMSVLGGLPCRAAACKERAKLHGVRTRRPTPSHGKLRKRQ